MQTAIAKNKLLTALPREEYLQLQGHLEFVYLASGKELCREGVKSPYVYFPTTMIVALQQALDDGSMIEVGVIGREGMVGAPPLFDGCTFGTVNVQFGGGAYRVKNVDLANMFRSGGVLQALLMQYAWSFLFQAIKNSASVLHCSVEQRLARWLLERLERSSNNELKITQQTIASMLGVRRESITQSMGKLQAAGLVSCRRGAITILDRARLELFFDRDRLDRMPAAEVTRTNSVQFEGLVSSSHFLSHSILQGN